MSPNHRAIAHAMFQQDAVIELSPAVVEQMGRIQARQVAAGLFTAPEQAHEVELSPELEQQQRKVLDKVGRVERERDIAVEALKKICGDKPRFTAVGMRFVAREALNVLESR